METRIEAKDKVKVAGVSVRTTNREEAGPGGRLPQLWQSYMVHQKDFAAMANSGSSRQLYALYTEYESDVNGAYTVIIGHEVGEGSLQHEARPDTFATAEIPGGLYRVFTSRPGPVFEVIPELWGQIWSYYRDAEEKRAYTGDYELYPAEGFDPAHAVVEIYIAVK